MTGDDLVVLFDIDGTLITTGGAGRRALERTFGEHYGRSDVFVDFPFAGMTDRAIIREGLRRLGHSFEGHDIDKLFLHYVNGLKAELLLSRAEHRLHLGMAEAVAALRARPRTVVGLGTGNIMEGAKAKLTPLNAYSWFDFGGFGSDHEDRAELIRIGIERGRSRLSNPYARAIIVGDTPKDVAAAKKNDAVCIAVATGSYDVEALRDAGADHVFATLAENGALSAFE